MLLISIEKKKGKIFSINKLFPARQLTFLNLLGIGDWGLGIGDWGLGIGPIPNPQSPIPNPQSPFEK
jgi:hypothetical protein